MREELPLFRVSLPRMVVNWRVHTQQALLNLTSSFRYTPLEDWLGSRGWGSGGSIGESGVYGHRGRFGSSGQKWFMVSLLLLLCLPRQCPSRTHHPAPVQLL